MCRKTRNRSKVPKVPRFDDGYAKKEIEKYTEEKSERGVASKNNNDVTIRNSSYEQSKVNIIIHHIIHG